MSDEQRFPKPTEQPDFGEIPIPSTPPPPSSPPEATKRKATAAAPKKPSRRKKAARSEGKSWLWLVLPILPLPLLFLGYLAGIYYFLPQYIKGDLAKQLGRQLDRPVTVGQASLSPFTFALHLGEISIGTAASQANEPDLARVASLDALLRPAALLHRHVVLDDVRIDRLRANLLRRPDGSFNALPSGSNLFAGLDLLPSWLQVHGLRLHRSTVHFLDQPSGKKHLIEHIEFVLPADGQGAEPSLSAVVNSSPLQIIGQQQSGGEAARLMLQLDDLDPQQYLGLFPSLAEKLSLSAGRADALLEIILNDTVHPGQGPAITGTLTFTDLLAQSANAEEQPKQAFRLATPKAKLLIRANPLKHFYTIEELRLEEPQLSLPETQQELLQHGDVLASKVAALLNYGQLGVAVDKLFLSQGKVKSGTTEWKDINLELTGFQNAKATALAAKKTRSVLSLTAGSGSSTLSLQGSVEPQGSLSGSLALKNIQAELLQAYLGAGDKLHLPKGIADITGELRLEQDAAGKTSGIFAKTSVTLRDFSLKQSKTELLSGKLLQATDCSLDKEGIVCNKATLEEVDFPDADFFLANNKQENRVGFACSSLELKKSAATIQLGGIKLPLSNLNLSLNGLPGQLTLQAAIGKWGGLEISGAATKGEAGLNITGKISLRNIGAALLQPYLAASGENISFTKGATDISGTLRLEQGKLNISDSAVTLRDFVLQRNGAALVAGQGMTGTNCTLDRNARSMTCASVALDQAAFTDSDFFLKPAGRLHLATDKLEIKDSTGTLRLAGAEALALSGMNLRKELGKIKLEARTNNSGKLEINGTSTTADSGLAISGSLALGNMDAKLLNPYLSQGNEIQLNQGSLELSGTGSLNQTGKGAVLSLSDATLKLQDFALEHKGAVLLSGKTLAGEACLMNGTEQHLSCGKLTLAANFAAEAPGFFFQPESKLAFTCNDVEISNSSALLPVGTGANRPQLPLSGLELRLNGDQLHVQAAVGSQGSLQADGTLHKNSGTVTLHGDKLDIRLFNKAFTGIFQQGLALGLKQGSLNFSGQFTLPDNRFAGELSINDFAAANKRGDTLGWQKAMSNNVVLSLSPFKATIDQLSFQEPTALLANQDSGLSPAFFALFQDVPQITVEQCSISNASFNSFNKIQASAGPVKAGEFAAFSLNGMLHGGDFAVSGKVGRDKTEIDTLTAEHLPLDKVAEQLAEELKLKSGKISRTITSEEDQLDFSGFTPQSGSDYALTLALLTDKDGTFSMPLHSVPFAAHEETISAAAVNLLQRLNSQSTETPWLILDKLVPDISAAQKIAFIPGDKVPDFMNGLNGIRTLFGIRPHLGWAIQGCYDGEADRKQLFAQAQKSEVEKVAAENLRRQKEMERQIANENARQEKLNKAGLPIIKDMLPEIKAAPDLQLLPMPQAEVSDNTLLALADARAAVVREHLINTLALPADHVQIKESTDCGAEAGLMPIPIW